MCEEDVKKLTAGGLQNHFFSTKRTLLLPVALHNDEAADTKDMFALKTDRLECDIETYRAEVVVDLRHNSEELV